MLEKKSILQLNDSTAAAVVVAAAFDVANKLNSSNFWRHFLIIQRSKIIDVNDKLKKNVNNNGNTIYLKEHGSGGILRVENFGNVNC